MLQVWGLYRSLGFRGLGSLAFRGLGVRGFRDLGVYGLGLGV